jgi:hypothetical protein
MKCQITDGHQDLREGERINIFHMITLLNAFYYLGHIMESRYNLISKHIDESTGMTRYHSQKINLSGSCSHSFSPIPDRALRRLR